LRLLKVAAAGDNPSPMNYNSKSQFDKKSPDGKCYTFGIAREAYSRVIKVKGNVGVGLP
jgi:hypothetical protein